MVGASCMTVITALLLGLSDNTILFASIILLFGIFWACILPLTDALSISISESTASPDSPPADYGRLRVWGSVGFIISTLGGGLWLVGEHISAFPLVLGALMFIVVFASLGFPKRTQIMQAKANPTAKLEPFPTQFYIVLAIAFMMQASHGAYYGFFSLYLADAGYTGTQIGLYWVVGVIAEIVLMWLWSRPIQQAAPALVFSLCLLLASLRWLGIGMTSDPILLTVLQLLHAASFAAFHVAAIVWVKRLAPDTRHAAAQGSYSAAGFGLGSTVGIMGCGLIVAESGFVMAFYLCALIALLGIPLAWFLRKPRYRKTSLS
jgi:PPP family 3-phenylpropionic acid transporter